MGKYGRGRFSIGGRLGGGISMLFRFLFLPVCFFRYMLTNSILSSFRYVKLSEITQDAWLTEGWDPECSSEQGQVLLSFTESVGNGWMACQVWGFATVDGVRRHVRRIYSKKGKEEHRVRLVYDYKGDVPAATAT